MTRTENYTILPVQDSTGEVVDNRTGRRVATIQKNAQTLKNRIYRVHIRATSQRGSFRTLGEARTWTKRELDNFYKESA